MDQLPFSLDEVVINSELLRRQRRPDHEAENEAFMVLAHTVADSPGMILQKLAETALQLCRADTAGISLLSGAIQKPYHIDEVLKKIETAIRSSDYTRSSRLPKSARAK